MNLGEGWVPLASDYETERQDVLLFMESGLGAASKDFKTGKDAQRMIEHYKRAAWGLNREQREMGITVTVHKRGTCVVLRRTGRQIRGADDGKAE